MQSRTSFLTRTLGASLGLSLSLTLVLIFLVPGVNAQILTHQVGWPVLRIIFFVTLGLAAGEIIEATGWTRSLSVVARPLFSFARLGQRCSATFTAAFVSGVAANGMLVSFYDRGLIDKKRLFLTNFINQLPAFFLHLPTTLFVILPLTGAPGGMYLLLLLVAAVLRTGLCALYGRLRLSPPAEDAVDSRQAGTQKKTSASDIPGLILNRVPRRLGRIIQFVIPIYILVFTLHHLGCFDFIQTVMAGTAVSALIPIEALSMVVISFLADYTSGFATAGALASSGVLSN
ncbi:MAG: nucleoside recognition protein, partial [Thermodesulfobacteriota bacterium]